MFFFPYILWNDILKTLSHRDIIMFVVSTILYFAIELRNKYVILGCFVMVSA